MAETATDQLKFIDVRGPALRILLILVVMMAFVGSWYAIRWCVGSTIAEFAPGGGDDALSAASSAIRLAPDDPLAHWGLGKLEQTGLSEDDLRQAVRAYEDSVRLSPNDYRLWMDLGLAREQAGDSAGGERALRHATDLAPNYSWPHWFLGNILLREGRNADAFAELRRAEATDETFRQQVFNLAWQVYKGNVAAVRDQVCRTAGDRAELALFLAGHQRSDDALSTWASLEPGEKKAARESGESLMNAFVSAHHYRAALDVYRDLAADPAEVPAPEQFQNGGFETEMGSSSKIFGWQITKAPQAKIALDATNPHGGKRSLRINFNAPTNFGFGNISQLVVVEPGVQYRFTCWVRDQGLKSGGMPYVQIHDAEGTVLASSQPLTVPDSDWHVITLDFRAPVKSDAIVAQLNRANCDSDAVCPIFGTIWYDDFNLERTGARTGGSS